MSLPGGWSRELRPATTTSRLEEAPRTLEHQLQHKLQNAGIPGRGDFPVSRRADRRSRVIEVDVVEHVEELGAELQSGVLSNCGILDHAQVRIEGTRPSQEVPSRAAKRADGVDREQRRIE